MFGPDSILYALGAAVVVAFIAFMKGRLSGAERERNKQAASEAKARDIADEIDDAIAGRDPGKNRKDLKSWSRR